jgi:hypothetical protein
MENRKKGVRRIPDEILKTPNPALVQTQAEGQIG